MRNDWQIHHQDSIMENNYFRLLKTGNLAVTKLASMTRSKVEEFLLHKNETSQLSIDPCHDGKSNVNHAQVCEIIENIFMSSMENFS